MLRLFEACNLPQPHIVDRQWEPDADFPTVIFPNPEEGAETWELAFKTGDAQDCLLAIANDPDGDRLAVAQRIHTPAGR